MKLAGPRKTMLFNMGMYSTCYDPFSAFSEMGFINFIHSSSVTGLQNSKGSCLAWLFTVQQLQGYIE